MFFWEAFRFFFLFLKKIVSSKTTDYFQRNGNSGTNGEMVPMEKIVPIQNLPTPLCACMILLSLFYPALFTAFKKVCVGIFNKNFQIYFSKATFLELLSSTETADYEKRPCMGCYSQIFNQKNLVNFSQFLDTWFSRKLPFQIWIFGFKWMNRLYEALVH